jgi:predicted permease
MPPKLQRWKRRLRYWLRRGERQRLLAEEMEFHVGSYANDLMEEGMSPEDARYEARRRFGNMTQQSENARGIWIARWLSDAAQDLRYTFRTLRREASFTTFAILIIGLGIGASSTVFSAVNALLLRPLPFADPSRLIWIANQSIDNDLSGQTVQVGHMLDFRAQSKSYTDVAAYFAFYGVGDNKLTGAGEPERLSGVPVSQNFFPLLGVKPLIGRLFNDDECKWNGPKAVLLSYGLWTRRFASDQSIVGRSLTIDDAPVTVVGVLPPSFDFSSVFAPASHIDLYSPFPLTPETNRWGNTLAIIGRLKPGVSIASARSEAAVLGRLIHKAHPERNDFDPRVTFLEEHVAGRFRPALFVLVCAVVVVMLIVCANLSNLQLARTAARQKEMAIRAAVGAGRSRLIRQLLTESLVLSICGALLGLILAIAGTHILAHLDGVSIPLLDRVRVDGFALGFTLLVAFLAGAIFGLLPALHIPALSVHDTLKESNRGSSTGKGHAWIRSGLVVSEIAFACVLLVGAGLLIRSFLRVLDVNLGFQPARGVTMRIDPSSRYRTQDQKNAYFTEALRLVKGIEGVEGAGLTDALPLGHNRTWGVGAKGVVYSRDNYPEAFVRIISDGYFRAMGIPMLEGRDLTARDLPTTEKVIVINATLAHRLWPGRDAIGQIVNADVDRRVVGVVGDVRHLALEQASGSEMYLPMRQTQDYGSVDLVVRTSLPAAPLAASVRVALAPIEPNLPAHEFRTLQQLVDKAVSPRRLVVLLLTGFSAFALILASLGIYGVVSYSVGQRTQEIGIRMALGASASDLQARIIFQTLGLAAVGMLIGAVASWALARTLTGLLYEVTSTDPLTFGVMLIVLTVVAAVAGYLPARRASRIDPMIALRAE